MTENEKKADTSQEASELKDAVLEGAATEIAQETAREATDGETPEERGEQLGENIAKLEQAEAAQAANPAAVQADKKKHIGVIVAAVAFAVVLVGAGVAYSALAPANQASKIAASPAAVDSASQDAAQSADSAGSSAGTDTAAPGPTNDPDATQADPESGVAGSNAPEDANTTTPAPDFTMTDASGKTVSLADFKGKPILLNFWASWCGPCQSEMPAMQAAYEQYGSEIEFLIVNMTGMSGETQETASQFIKENGYTFPVYYDQSSSAQAAYGVSAVPQTYLIDPEGNIIGAAMGALDTASIEQGIQMLQAS